MSDVFISYARSTEAEAQRIADALRASGYAVWIDDQLPAHRAYGDVIEERLAAAKAVLVIWSDEAVKSQWVRAEANRAREVGKLVQVNLDGTRLPLPFDQVQCADLGGWRGDANAPGWQKVVASIAELIRGPAAPAPVPGAASTAPTLPLPAKPSIAVMPFANLSGDPEQEYFADGMVTEITTALSRCRSIFVIASSSTLSFKGKAVSAQEVGRQLGVRYVLEGNVRKAGGRVRIAAQLVDTQGGEQIWGDRFEDTLDDVFALQDDVALSVAGVLEPAVRAAEMRRVVARPTGNMGSYDLCLRAYSLLRSYVKADYADALALLERAITLEPENGTALAHAASCHHILVGGGWSENPELSRRTSIELAQRALKVAQDDPEILTRVALVTAYQARDTDAAVALVERALALNPGSAYAWAISGSIHTQRGELALADEHLARAARLDPVGPTRISRVMLQAMAAFQGRRFGDAVVLAREASQTTEVKVMHLVLAASHAHLGQIDSARLALARFRALSPATTDEVMEFANGESKDLARQGIALIAAADAAERDADPTP